MKEYYLNCTPRPSLAGAQPQDGAPPSAMPAVTFSSNGFVAGIWTEVKASDFAEYLRQMALMESLPKNCGLCGSAHLTPVHRRHQQFEFFEINCKHCKAVFHMGRRRDNGALFPNWKRGWQPAWSPADPSPPAAG